MGTQDSKKDNFLFLDQILIDGVPEQEYTLKLFVENVEREIQRKDDYAWAPEQRPYVSPTSQIRAEVRMKTSGYSFWAKYQEAIEVIDLHGLFDDYWSTTDDGFTVLKAIVIGNYSGYLGARFSVNYAVLNLRELLHDLDDLLHGYIPLVSGKEPFKVFEYAAFLGGLIPAPKTVFDVAMATFKLLKEQTKYDQVLSDLCDQVQRILPLTTKVAYGIVSEETEIQKELISRVLKVVQKVAKLSSDYVRRAETTGGPSYSEMIEEMGRELSKLIEDFDREMNVEVLCMTDEIKREE